MCLLARSSIWTESCRMCLYSQIEDDKRAQVKRPDQGWNPSRMVWRYFSPSCLSREWSEAWRLTSSWQNGKSYLYTLILIVNRGRIKFETQAEVKCHFKKVIMVTTVYDVNLRSIRVWSCCSRDILCFKKIRSLTSASALLLLFFSPNPQCTRLLRNTNISSPARLPSGWMF